MKADTSKPKAVTKAPATAAKGAAAPVSAKATKPAASTACQRLPLPLRPRGREPASPLRATRPSSRLAQLTKTIDGPGSGFHRCQSQLSTHHAHDRASATYLAHVLPKDPKLANNWKTKTAEELTDAEVMAMPDSEYMNDKQMAFFRLKLVQLKRGHPQQCR